MTLLEFIEKHAVDYKKRIISNLVRDKKKWFDDKGFEEYYEMLMEQTSFLLPDVSFSLRIHCIQNNIKEYPKCNVCGKDILEFKQKRKTKQVCSLDCNSKSKVRTTTAFKAKIEKYGYAYNNHEKGKQTKIQKYGEEFYNNHQKQVETCLDRYGVINVWKIQSNIDKSLKTKRAKQYKRLSSIFSDRYDTVDADKFIFKCKKCNDIISLDSTRYWTNEIRCYTCYPQQISLSESELQSWLISLVDIECNKKILSKNFEIDILIKDKNLAIEFDGIYWHSEDHKPDKNYHLNKTIECEDLGIQLLHIFENEWLDPIKQEIWKSIIKSKLGLNESIGARKTIIKEVVKKEAVEFLSNNHLQGNCQSSVNLGLYYQDELVSLLTLSKSRFNKNYEWEITRFCNKVGLNVLGGFSKLLSHFRACHEGSIITYADKRYSTGDMYSKSGFTELKDSSPNYWYWKTPEKLFSRIEFQKHKLIEKLEKFEPDLTEVENMRMNGYKRIWDCGNKVLFLN